MDNIIDTFNINKKTIKEEEILKLNDNQNENDISDIIVKKKKLIEMSNNLNKIEYMEILNIIEEDNCTYSNNSNGVFINLTNVEMHTIDKIYNFLKFTKQKKEELVEKENYLENFKKNINKEEEIVEKKVENKDNEDNESMGSLSDNSENINVNDYLCFSSDDEDNKNVKK